MASLNSLQKKGLKFFLPLKLPYLSVIYLAVFVLTGSGCYHSFYDTNTRFGVDSATADSLKNNQKYVVMHLNNDTRFVAVKNVSISKNQFDADIDTVVKLHLKYLHPDVNSSPRYKVKYKKAVLNEIHVYAPDQKTTGHSHLSFPLTEINRVDIYKKNRSKTTTNTVLSSIGLFVTTASISLFTLALISIGNHTFF